MPVSVSDIVLAEARAAAVTNADVVVVIGLVALHVPTNHLNNVSETAIDFPLVALDAAA